MDILLLRIGRLGDMVMILPALKEIKRLYPQANIHCVTSVDGLRLLQVFGIDKKNLFLYRHHLIYRLLDTYKVKQYIKQGHFDLIYCFESKKRTTSWLPAGANIIQNQAFLEHYALKCLKLVNPMPEYDHREQYLPVNASKEKDLQAILQSHNISPDTILIGLHPTYSGFDKWGRKKEKMHRLWPWQNFVDLAIRLTDYAQTKELNLKVVMDLLPNERQLGIKIQQASANKAILFSTEPDFKRYLCFINRLNVLIAPNTGVMHLAAALNTPVVALFSDLHPGDCGPYMPEENYVTLRAEDYPNSSSGLAAISVSEVFDNTIALLEHRSSH